MPIQNQSIRIAAKNALATDAVDDLATELLMHSRMSMSVFLTTGTFSKQRMTMISPGYLFLYGVHHTKCTCRDEFLLNQLHKNGI